MKHPALERTQEFVEVIGGVEVGFELPRGEFFAEIVEPAGEEIERGGEEFLVGENDVAPRGIGAAGEAEGIAEAGTSEGDGQTVFIEAVVEKRSQRDGGKLRKMGCQADGVIMLLGAEPKRPSADFFEEVDEGGNTWMVGGAWFICKGRSSGLKTFQCLF